MNNEYELSTITDILALEQDQIERFCQELPRITAYIKALQALAKSAAGESGEIKFMEMVIPLKWIDDGKQDMTIDIQCSGENVATLEVKKEKQQ